MGYGGSSYSPNRALDVNVQDQTTEVIDLYMCKELATTTTDDAVSVGDNVIPVTSTVGAVAGDCINISYSGRTYQAVILSVSAGVSVTINAPMDFDAPSGVDVCYGEWDMATSSAGTVANPEIWKVGPPAGVKWDIVRVTFGINDATAMDDGKFGGAASLTNGIVLQVVDGYTKNIFVVNNNGGFRERSYDVTYVDATLGPSGEYGFGCRRTFGGQNKNGVVIRLDGDNGDKLQILVQDDLTDVTKFACVAQGHAVED